MGHEFQLIDAFSATPLLGNPVAVFFGADDLDAITMQKIAMEMHLSEVTFMSAPKQGGSVAVRIFTPINELPFAGHPLIGTGRAYLDRMGLISASFETKVGTINVWNNGNSSDRSTIFMQQPVPSVVNFNNEDLVLSELNIKPCRAPTTLYENGPRHLLVHLPSLEDLMNLRPNHQLLAKLSNLAVNCFAINDGIIFNRMFSPAYGVIEDPGTGSAAGPLAVHCQRYGLVAGPEVIIEQGHALGKRCIMMARIQKVSNDIQDVIICGYTAIVGAGYLVV